MDKPLKTPPKISVRIWTPLLREFDKAIESSCLRRDAYLTKLLEQEIGLLDEEVAVANSEAAYAHVAALNERLPRKLVSLALRPELTERLNTVCRSKRIVRDAFFNRIFLLLAVPELVDLLFFSPEEPEDVGPGWRDMVMSENKDLFRERAFYPLLAPVDPFKLIRLGLEMVWREAVAEDAKVDERGNAWLSDLDGPYGGQHLVLAPKVYTRVFTGFFNDSDGSQVPLGFMNCHMPDHHVPSTDDSAPYEASLRELAKGARLSGISN